MAARLRCRQSAVVLTTLVLLVSVQRSLAQTENGARLLPREEEALYRAVPDITVRTIDGTTLPFSSLWRERPILLTFVSAHCSGVCHPYLRSLRDAIRRVGGLGSAYEVVVLSFVPKDTLAELRLMAEATGLSPTERPHWHFGIGASEAIRQLEQTVRFWHRRVKGTNQYDHPAMLAAIKDGKVVRLLVGATVLPPRLREVVRELEGETVLAYPLPDAKIPFRCFRYDPKTGAWRPDWGVLALLMPPSLTAMSVLYLFWCKGCPRDTQSVRRSDRFRQ